MRSVHQEMVEATLGGDGLERVAALAAAQVDRVVVIVVPARDLAVVSPDDSGSDRLEVVQRRLSDHVEEPNSEVPVEIELLVPVRSGSEQVGAVAMLSGKEPPSPEAAEFLHLAALATLTSLALEGVREEEEARLRGGLIEELREAPLEGREASRRAARLGCDLARGAAVMLTEVRSSRPRQAMALVSADYPGALAELLDGRIYALLPARGGDEAPELTLTAARGLAERLRKCGPTAISSFYADPSELHRAVEEAELVLEVVARDERMADHLADMGSGVYRLLFRVFASHPEEVRSFYEDTVAAIVHYDERYHTDLLGTLEAYLANECNMNATARTIYAHRHTVAYRLERIEQLTGLDPTLSEHRERLGLGLKAYRIVAPTLPR